MSDVSSDVCSSDLRSDHCSQPPRFEPRRGVIGPLRLARRSGSFLLLGFKRPGHVDAGLNAIKPPEPQGSCRAFPLAVFLKSDILLSGVRKGSGNAQTGTSRDRHATRTVFVTTP